MASIAALHGQFVPIALGLGLGDFDAAALKDGRARSLTQAVSTYLYSLTLDDGQQLAGIEFASRHGDDLTLWAVYERPGRPAGVPPYLRRLASRPRRQPPRPDDGHGHPRSGVGRA